MAISPPKELVGGTLVSDSATSVYTAPANVSVLVTHATAHNTDTVARLIEVWIGTAANDASKVFTKSIAADATETIEGVRGRPILAGDQIFMVCDAASVVSIALGGISFPVE